MNKFFTKKPAILVLAVLFASCASSPVNPERATHSSSMTYNIPILPMREKQKIGKKIWQNECGGTMDGLTSWNEGEEFASLGIGHFIWYPKGFKGRWTESFPIFIRYARRFQGHDMPQWVLKSRYCPWKNKQDFDKDFNSKKLTELRDFLSKSVAVQTDFIMSRSQMALPKIFASSPGNHRKRIMENYRKVASTANGAYALIDYVNFKGDGTNPTERYAGQGWGLMWVLMEMKKVMAGQQAAKEFASAAKRCLDRRIKNSPPERGEHRWRSGWHKRCDTYAQPL